MSVVVGALAPFFFGSVLFVSVCFTPACFPAGAQAVGSYQPPVDAPVIDTFRPPDERWQAGNRGWEYAVQPGMTVRAAGGGVVAFAGTIAGVGYVSLQHPDGFRTTYSWLEQLHVSQGTELEAGTVLGITSARFHFGVKRGADYVDPATLFGAARSAPRLVPLVNDAVRTLGERRWRSAVGVGFGFGF